MTRMRVEFLLTAVVGLGALSIDMFLPSLPAIATTFGAAPATVQLTITLFLMAFAVAQLVYGPLSDRFGRRWVLIGGLGLYAVSGLACALAPTISILIGARVLQALEGGVGPVVARAVVRDLYERERAARVFSYMSMVQSLNPMLAPIVGGYVLETFGRRAIFVVLAALGARFVALMMADVRETNVRRDPNALRPGQMAHNVGLLLTDRTYLGYVLVNALMFGGQFAFISGSPFVLIEVLGSSRGRSASASARVSLGIMTGTFLSGRFGAVLGLDRTIRYGTVLGAAGGLNARGPGLERRADGGVDRRADVRVRDGPRPHATQRHGGRHRPVPAHGGPRRRGGQLPRDDRLRALQHGGGPLPRRHRPADDQRDSPGRRHRPGVLLVAQGEAVAPACWRERAPRDGGSTLASADHSHLLGRDLFHLAGEDGERSRVRRLQSAERRGERLGPQRLRRSAGGRGGGG